MSSEVLEAGVTPGHPYYEKNPVVVEADSYALIPLSGERGKGKFALVDLEDLEHVIKYTWNLNRDGYALSSSARAKSGTGLMHRFILGNPKGLDVDHKEPALKLDNRRSNLRSASRTQNLRNTRSRAGSSHYKGVNKTKYGTWSAQIKIGGGDIGGFSLGSYKTEEQAARVYDEAARYYFGDFARTNFEGTARASVQEIKQRLRARRNSQFMGVRLATGKYEVQIYVNGSRVYLGRYASEFDAAKARDSYILENGLNLKLNLPDIGH